MICHILFIIIEWFMFKMQSIFVQARVSMWSGSPWYFCSLGLYNNLQVWTICILSVGLLLKRVILDYFTVKLSKRISFGISLGWHIDGTKGKIKEHFSSRRYTTKHAVNIQKAIRRLKVHLKKEADWLVIQRKRRIGCWIKERVNQPQVIIHPTPVSQKKERKG